TIVLRAAVDQAPLARLIVKKAYELGAAEVLMQWSDDVITKEFMLHAADDRIATVPQYKIEESNDWLEKGASRISLVSNDPGALAGVDGKRLATFSKANNAAFAPLMQALQANKY